MTIEKRLGPKEAEEEAAEIKRIAGEVTGREENPYTKEECEVAADLLEESEGGQLEKITPNQVLDFSVKDLENFGRESLEEIHKVLADYLRFSSSLDEKYRAMSRLVQKKYSTPNGKYNEDFIIAAILPLLQDARQKRRKEKQREKTRVREQTERKAAEEARQRKENEYLERWARERRPLHSYAPEDMRRTREAHKKLPSGELQRTKFIEGIFVEAVRKDRFFSPEAEICFASDYDDVRNGVDFLVSLPDDLVIGVDFTTSRVDLREKVRRNLDHPFRVIKYPTHQALYESQGSKQGKEFLAVIIGVKKETMDRAQRAFFGDDTESNKYDYSIAYRQILGQLYYLLEEARLDKEERLKINKAIQYFKMIEKIDPAWYGKADPFDLEHPEVILKVA